MVLRTSGSITRPVSTSAPENATSTPILPSASELATAVDFYGRSAATSLWNWTNSALSAIAPPSSVSPATGNSIQADAVKFRQFAADLVVASGTKGGDSDRAAAVREVLANHPEVVLWLASGKDLEAIAQAADLPSMPQVENPILANASAIGSAIKTGFNTVEDFWILGSSLSAAKAAYAGMSMGSLFGVVGALGTGLGTSAMQRMGRNALIEYAANAARSKAEQSFCSLSTKARTELLNQLPESVFSGVANQIDKTIVDTKISESDEIQMMMDPDQGFDLSQVPAAFKDFFENVLTKYFDELPLEDKRRIAVGLLQLPPGASDDQKLGAILNYSGPAMQKLFQLFGDDVKSEKIGAVMKELKSQIKPFDSAIAIKMIEKDLGGTTDELFSSFREKPLAAASVGQVYLATEKESGQDVIIKVMRPNIRERATREIALLKRLAPSTGTRKIVDRLEESLFEELDFRIEAKNMADGEVYWKPQKGIFPIFKADMFETTTDVLVMERAYENPIDKFHAKDLPLKSEALGTFLETWYDEALFGSGFFHADLHAGNIFFNPTPLPGYAPYGRDYQITLIDFGSCGRLDKKEKKAIITLILGSAAGNSALVVNAFKALCPMTSDQEEEFKAGVEDIYAKGADASETCNLVVNKAIEMELGLPKNFILFNRGRAFLENQMRDTTKELNEWDPDKKVPRADSLQIFSSLLKWRLGQDVLKTIFRFQSGSDALIDGTVIGELADQFLIGDDYDEDDDMYYY